MFGLDAYETTILGERRWLTLGRYCRMAREQVRTVLIVVRVFGIIALEVGRVAYPTKIQCLHQTLARSEQSLEPPATLGIKLEHQSYCLH
jgi:hypothetical protein